MTAFLQTDAGGWSWDIPEREDDESPDLERSLFANRERAPRDTDAEDRR